MTVKTFDELVAKVKSGKKSTVALVCANDAHALEAVIHASDLVDAVLVVEADKLDELKALLVSYLISVLLLLPFLSARIPMILQSKLFPRVCTPAYAPQSSFMRAGLISS